MSEIVKASPENTTDSIQPITTYPTDQAEKSPNQPEKLKRSRAWRIVNAVVKMLSPENIYIP